MARLLCGTLRSTNQFSILLSPLSSRLKMMTTLITSVAMKDLKDKDSSPFWERPVWHGILRYLLSSWLLMMMTKILALRYGIWESLTTLWQPFKTFITMVFFPCHGVLVIPILLSLQLKIIALCCLIRRLESVSLSSPLNLNTIRFLGLNHLKANWLAWILREIPLSSLFNLKVSIQHRRNLLQHPSMLPMHHPGISQSVEPDSDSVTVLWPLEPTASHLWYQSITCLSSHHLLKKFRLSTNLSKLLTLLRFLTRKFSLAKMM